MSCLLRGRKPSVGRGAGGCGFQDFRREVSSHGHTTVSPAPHALWVIFGAGVAATCLRMVARGRTRIPVPALTPHTVPDQAPAGERHEAAS